MNVHEIAAEISRQAKPMSEYHAQRFASAAHAAFKQLPQDTVTQASIATFARNYSIGVENERYRILSIDDALKSMPPGCESLAHTAKFETQMDASEFRQQAIRALGQTSHAMFRMRR